MNGKIPIIGVGGVNSGKSAYEKIIAGASLLQLYTSFVYKGPSIAKDIKKELMFLYDTNLIFLNTNKIKLILKDRTEDQRWKVLRMYQWVI